MFSSPKKEADNFSNTMPAEPTAAYYHWPINKYTTFGDDYFYTPFVTPGNPVRPHDLSLKLKIFIKRILDLYQ
jgi:hypothetical protein